MPENCSACFRAVRNETSQNSQVHPKMLRHVTNLYNLVQPPIDRLFDNMA